MLSKEKDNLFLGIPDTLKEEIFEILLQTNSFTLERIVSQGHITRQGQWLEQEAHEWVILVTGSAKIIFEEKKDVLVMAPGDYLHIPAKCRHRVEWTHPEKKTVWLALHYKEK